MARHIAAPIGRTRATAVVLATLAGLASLVAPGLARAGTAATPHVSTGPLAYWTKSRFLGATPFPAPKAQRAATSNLSTPSATPTPNPVRARNAIRVGALFVRSASGNHYCTASVVASTGKNVLITAAHCINGGKNGGYRKDIVFVPDYHNGDAPYGVWTPTNLVVAAQWQNQSNPNMDVGFILLNKLDGKDIQTVLNANRLGRDTKYRYFVRVTGYPDSSATPITCVNWTARESATQLRFLCNDYTDGTSGSPWVTDYNSTTHTGTIVGVIGGYQQGGDTPAISYSSYFGSAIQALYRQAVAEDG